MGSSVKDIDITKNSIQYLYNISTLKELNSPAVKSFYSTRRRLLEFRNQIFIPSSLTRSTVSCQRCFLPLADGPASYRIKAKKKLSKFAKKSLSKKQKGINLTEYQKKYLSRIEHNSNELEITCKFCKKQRCIPLVMHRHTDVKDIKSPGKKRKRSKSNVNEKPMAPVQPITVTPKKKKKKKDKFCGLNKEAVLSLSLSTQNLRIPVIVKKKKVVRVTKVKKRVQPPPKPVETPVKVISQRHMAKKNKLLHQLSNILDSSPSPNKSLSQLKKFLHSMN